MKKQIQLVVLFIFLLGKTTSAQENQLIDFGKPFKVGNIVNLSNYVVPSSKYANDFTAILIDKGKLNPNNNVLPLNCFKVLFVDLLNKKIQKVEVKDRSGNVITESIGDPFTWTFGLDGNIYMGTQAGGHLVCIDYKNRTVTDLGKPINFDGIPNLTTLSLGSDFNLYGIINKYNGSNQGPYSFKYNYNFSFTTTDSLPIDSERIRAKQIGADDKYIYVRCENADYALYAINKITKEKKRITLNYNNSLLNPVTAFEIENYASDYVYARISVAAGIAHYWKLYNGEVLDNEPPNKTLRIRVDCIWNNILNMNTANITTMWNTENSKLHYSIGTTTDFVDLSSNIEMFERPTALITNYFNAAKNRNELFIHGAKYSIAASMNYQNNNEITILGANSSISAYAAIADFDSSKVLIGGYSNGLIQSYNSLNSWNIFTNIQSPATTAANANPLIKYQVQNPLNSINNVPGVIAATIIKKINNLKLYVAGGSRGRNNPPYYQEEIGFSIINATTNQIKNIYIPEFLDYHFSSLDIDQTNNKIIIIGVKKENPGMNTVRLFIFNANGELQGNSQALAYNNNLLIGDMKIEVCNKTVYATCDNKLYRINDYNNANATMDLMYNLAGYGAFKALKLFTLNNKVYVAFNYIDAIDYGFKFAYMPANAINNNAPNYESDVVKVNGKILEESGSYPCEMTFADGKIFLSGFTSIYGFTPTAINNLSNGGIANNESLKISPNPAKSVINISYTATLNEKVQLQVYSNEGIILYNKQVNTITGKNNFPLNISSYTSGNFFVTIAGKEKMSTTKFIKE